MAGLLVHVVVSVVAVALVLLTLPLVMELLVLSMAALVLPEPKVAAGEGVPAELGVPVRLAVVVPAHNEQQLVGACVRSLLQSQRPPDALFAVAHNCTDDTAAEAKAAGARVLPLEDDGVQGKGAALLFGLAHAVDAGYTAVLVVDADSTVDVLLTAEVAAAFAAGADAVQARYVAGNAGATARTGIMAVSLTGINVVRPRGRGRMGLSCGIFGNGFALSAATLRAVPYTAHSVVEDLEYHLALVASGRRVRFLDGVTVRGELPDNDRAAGTQRARWEGGRARIRRDFVPRLTGQVLRGRLRLMEPLLDLLSVPLTTVVPLLMVLALLPLGWARVYAAAGLLTLGLYVAAAVALTDEPAQAARALMAVPGFLLFKVRLMGAKRRAAQGQAAWVRTERNVGTGATAGSVPAPDEEMR